MLALVALVHTTSTSQPTDTHSVQTYNLTKFILTSHCYRNGSNNTTLENTMSLALEQSRLDPVSTPHTAHDANEW
jgi:hypothetical protein